MPTVPLSRPSVMTHCAPASRSPAISLAHCSGGATSSGFLLPTSAITSNRSVACRMSSCLADTLIGATPRETSTRSKPTDFAQSRQASAWLCIHAISSSVPPRQERTPASRSRLSLSARVGSMYAVPHPNFQTSTCAADAARIDRVDSTVSPLSSTWVRPAALGLLLRSGRVRNDGRGTLPILHFLFTFRQGAASSRLRSEGGDR